MGDIQSGRSVESNAVESLLFDPTVYQIEAMESEVFHLERRASDFLDASAMVLIKSVVGVDAPWGILKITNQYDLLPPLLYPNIPMRNL